MRRALFLLLPFLAACAGPRGGGYSADYSAPVPASAATALEAEECAFYMEDCMAAGLDEADCRGKTGC